MEVLSKQKKEKDKIKAVKIKDSDVRYTQISTFNLLKKLPRS